jgi:hypothetical protein
MNCDLHPEKKATHWRKGLAQSAIRIYMCLSCANNARDIIGLKTYEMEPPSEHCPDCDTHTGGGRCGFCDDLRDKELKL